MISQDYIDTLKAVQKAGYFGYIQDKYLATGEALYKLLEYDGHILESHTCNEYDTLAELRDDMLAIAKDYPDKYHPKGHDYEKALATLNKSITKGV